jgi:sialic acid synthase
MKKGEIITEKDIHLLSPGDGFKWSEKENVIGKILQNDIKSNEIIYKDIL